MDQHFAFTTYNGTTFSLTDVLIIDGIKSEGNNFTYTITFTNGTKLPVIFSPEDGSTYEEFEQNYAELLRQFETAKKQFN